MSFVLTPEQEMLRESVRSFLESKAPMSRVRQLMETESGQDPALWREMADMGIPAMHIPEEFGGAGFTPLDLGIVLEETGRALAPSPLFSSVVLGANLLILAGSEAHKREHLPAIAAGERTLAVAVVEPGGDWAVDSVKTKAVGASDGVELDGVKSYVVDGHTADLIAVAARDADGEIGFHLVAPDTPGVTVEKVATMDMTRQQATVVLDGVRVPSTSRLERGGDGVVADLYDLAAVALAFEQVGGAARCLEMSVDYAGQRHQFGRPIGSFQAVKHTCADMLVAVESARSVAYHGGWAAAEDPGELRVAGPLAKAHCSDAYFQVAADTIQVHGGIGFTWEHDAHLYFKRAKSSQLMFGTPATWRRILADRLGI